MWLKLFLFWGFPPRKKAQIYLRLSVFSWGVPPRTSDDPPAGPSDLSQKHQINQLHGSGGHPPTAGNRAKRENGGLGEDPPGSPITQQVDSPPGPKFASNLYKLYTCPMPPRDLIDFCRWSSITALTELPPDPKDLLT
jgi:hypothetical protein